MVPRPDTFEAAAPVSTLTAFHSFTEERLHILRPSDLPGVELWSVKECIRYWNIYHRTYTFCVSEKTAVTWKYRRQSYDLTPRSTMLMEPGEIHSTIKKPFPTTFRMVFIEPHVFKQYAGDQNRLRDPHFLDGQIDDDDIARLLKEFCRSIETHQADTLEKEEYLHSFIVSIQQKQGERIPQPPQHARGCEREVRLVRDLIQDKYQDSSALTLQKLAHAAQLSKCYLVSAFTEKTGKSPHQYLKLVRVGRALELIRKGVILSDVASHVGFADQAHLTREMRRQLGFTPGQFRKVYCKSKIASKQVGGRQVVAVRDKDH